ncbi:MAG: DUF5711 family protein [Oscillospiraceae bacterium]|nr:DUF5711 family protein [Oscillospiraceae bacterium]
MFGEKKSKKKWHRLIGLIFSVVSLIILTYISMALISGRGVSFAWFTNIFTRPTPIEVADELLFDVGRDRVFVNLHNSIAAAGALGIQVLDYDGNEVLRDSFWMHRPAVSANNSRAIAFDIGGTAVRVFDSNEVLSSLEASGAIISASINRGGWFSVNTQEGGGLRSMVMVYNDRGNAVFRVELGSGYAFASVISPDNRNLAVLNLTDIGSRITLYQGMNRSEYDSVFVLPGGLILDMRFLSNGNLLAVSRDALMIIDRNGESRTLFEFADRRLGGFILHDNVTILHLLDYGVGHSGRIVKIDDRGRVLTEYDTDREIISMSYEGGYLAVLFSDGVMFFDRNLNAFSKIEGDSSAAGISRVHSLGGGVALATGEHMAMAVFKE